MISELLSFLSPCCQSDTPDQLHCSASGIWSNKVTIPRPSEKEIAQLHRSKKMTVVTDTYKRQNIRYVMFHVIQKYLSYEYLQCLMHSFAVNVKDVNLDDGPCHFTGCKAVRKKYVFFYFYV